MGKPQELCSKLIKLATAIDGNVGDGMYEYAEVLLQDLEKTSQQLREELNVDANNKQTKCLNCEGNCGMNNITDGRCCFYCEFKHNCNGFCATLEAYGDDEDIAKTCNDFREE